MTDEVLRGRDTGSQPLLQYAEWSSELELGVPLVDQQHRQFFEMAASLRESTDEVRVLRALALLSDYIRSHLHDEEALMEAANYPGLAAHRRLHDTFRRMLADLFSRARKMPMQEVGEEVRYLINGWFYNHIMTVDFEYEPYMERRHDAPKRERRG